MPKVILTFDVPEKALERLIPSDSLYVEITATGGTTYVTNMDTMRAGNWFQGFNAKLEVKAEM